MSDAVRSSVDGVTLVIEWHAAAFNRLTLETDDGHTISARFNPNDLQDMFFTAPCPYCAEHGA